VEERKVTNKKREVGRKEGCFFKVGKGGRKKIKLINNIIYRSKKKKTLPNVHPSPFN